MLNNNFQRILIKFGLWLATGILICLVGISGVFAQTIQGWAKNVDLYTDVNLLDCTSSSCSTSIGLTADYFYDTESLIKYNNFVSNSHAIASYGDMILNYHRYLPGYLYSSTSYVCFSSNVNLTNSDIDLYVGSYSDTINKVGNLTYHNVLVQTLDNHPYSPGDQYNKCYAIVNLFSPSVEGQNIGKVYKQSTSITSRTYLIGEKFESLGIYSGSIGNSLETIISSSGLATANSVQEIQQDIQEIQTNIINNQNDNNQALIDNQNANTDKEIESQKVCSNYNVNYESVIIKNKFLTTSGEISGSSSGVGITDYYKISTNSKITLTKRTNNTNISLCFYNNKSLISCIEERTLSLNQDVTIPDNANEVRFSINENTTGNFADSPNFSISACTNGNQALNDSINDLNDSLNDDDSSGATSEASEFFSSFNTNTFGLTSIITAPLNLIQSLTSSTCSELHLPLPYLNNKYLDLPCMTSIYQTHFGAFFTMYQTITYGIIAYWVCVRIFNQVKDFKNPEHDEIEVVDL